MNTPFHCALHSLRTLAVLGGLGLGLGACRDAEAAPALLGTQTTAVSSTAVTSRTLNRPVATGTRVLLLAQLSVRGNVTFTAPSSWTLVNRTVGGSGATLVTLAVYSKWVADLSTEPASYTWTFTSGRVAAAMFAISGAAPGTPVPVGAGQAIATNTTSMTAPTVSPSMGDTLLVGVWANLHSGYTYTPPAGMTERFEIGSGGTSSGTRIAVATQALVASGATGTRVAVSSTATQGSGILLAVAPVKLPPFYLQATGLPDSTLNSTPPTAAPLANHDPARDAAAGLVIAKGGSGATETTDTLYQRWLSDGQGIVLSGSFQLRIWTAMKDFDTSLGGTVNAYLRDCDSAGNNCSTLATASITRANWSGGSTTWVPTTFNFGSLNLQVDGPRKLELKLVVAGTSGDSMWFAYAAAANQSVIAVPLTAVDHYQVVLPSGSVSCLPSTVTVTACTDSSSPCTNAATTVSGQTATLAASAGTLASTALSFNASGVASTTLSYPTATNGAAAAVTLSGESSAANNVRRCCPDGSSCQAANICSTTFATAGFVIAAAADGAAATVPTQTAGTASGSFVLRAVRTGTPTAACEAAITGATTVDWAYECNDPATCSGSNLTSVDGGSATPVQRNNDGIVGSYTAVPMTFDASGNAPFSFTFNDVGLSTLWMRKTVGGALLQGASNAFISKPAGFTVTGLVQTAAPNTANPAANGATGGVFVKAGEAFTATVTATTSTGAAAPNFGRESSAEGVSLTPTLVLPAGGSSGTLSNGTVAGGSFTNGVATVTNLAFSEVGIVTLSPAVADGNYLGAGAVTGTPTGNVGRFVPARFTLSAPTLTHRAALACSPASAYTYLDENFRLTMTLTAQNSAGVTTTNYTGAFARFDATAATGWGLAGIDGSTVFSGGSGRLSLGSAAGSWSNGVLADAMLNAAALRGSAPDGPFNAVFGVAPTDPDGVALTTLDLDTDTPANGADRATVATVALRFGRLRLVNAIGAADRALALPLQAESWNGSGFALNTLDSCTTVPTGAVNLGRRRGSLTAADVTAAGPVTLVGGAGRLQLTAPAGGRSGTLDVALSLGATPADAACVGAWTPTPAATTGAGLAALRSNWCSSAYAHDPAARATFGRQRTSGSTVYRRENF